MWYFISILIWGVCLSPIVFAQRKNRVGSSFPYEVNLTFAIPAYDIVEPIRIHYDPIHSMQRFDYYNGMDITILKDYFSFNIVPQYDSQVCSKLPMKWLGSELVDVIPNTSAMQFNGTKTITVDSVPVLCSVYVTTVQNGSLISTYTYYEANATDSDDTPRPIKYVMHGFDIIFGSHYDEYVVTFQNYSTNSFSSDVFNVPDGMKCPFMASDDPISAMSTQPSNSLGRLFPWHEASQDMDTLLSVFAEKHSVQIDEQSVWHRMRYQLGSNIHFANSINRKQKLFRASVLDKSYGHLSLSDARNTLGLHKRSSRAVAMARRAEMPPAKGLAKQYHSTQLRFADAEPFNWVDKGAVTPIKDQGACGSCWSFGSHESIEGANFLKTGTLKSLSAQFLMDCGWDDGNHGCDGGLDTFAYDTIIRLGGIPTSDSYPYLMNAGYCNTTVPAAVKLTNYVNVTRYDEEALLDALTTHGPISIGIDVSDAMLYYTSGVFDDAACLNEPSDLDHAVTLVGWGYSNTQDQSDPYWIVKNSWATLWGEEGYIRILQKGNICGVATEPTYVNVQ